MSPLPLCPAGMATHVFANLALTNPLTYFNLVELVCRRELSGGRKLGIPAHMLYFPFLFFGENRLVSTWPSIKAYAAAFASWIKAYVRGLPAVQGSPAAAAALSVSALPDAAAASSATMDLLDMLAVKLSWFGADLPNGFALDDDKEGPDDWLISAMLDLEVKPTPRSMQLVLILLFARGVLGAGEQVVGVVPQLGWGSAGHKQTVEGDGDPYLRGSSRTSSSKSSHGESSTCSSSSSRSTHGKSGSCSSSSSRRSPGESSTCSSSSSSHGSSGKVGDCMDGSSRGRDHSLLMSSVVRVALKVHFCLRTWQDCVRKARCAEVDASPAQAAAAAEESGADAVDRDGPSLFSSTSSSSAAAAASAPAPGAAA